MINYSFVLHIDGKSEQDQNLVNQQNTHYTSLRARANEEGDAMARCFEESHQAYESGDGARAKELSNEGKTHKAEMERLNEEASAWIFRGEPLTIFRTQYWCKMIFFTSMYCRKQLGGSFK